jgi:tRNA (guanine37-N1)-methyltransferase
MLRVDVLTIFPGYLAPLGESLLGRARQRGLVEVAVHDLRDWTDDVHRTVDDAPYGGGPGMVMLPEVWGRAIDTLAPAGGPVPRLVVPSPAGRPFTQRVAQELATEPWLMFACGRYEGIDYRVVEHYRQRMPVDELSLGDYVLAGGEVATLVMLEAVSRLVPGVVGNAASVDEDSFSDGLLEWPAYTRPEVWRGLAVPEVLRSGHHGKIARWRRDQALLRTAERRPDLLARLPAEALDRHDREVLAEAGFSLPPPHVAP